LGGFDLPSLPEVFSRIQCATLFGHDSYLSYERTGECDAFVTTHGSSGSYRGRRGGRGGCGFRGGHDSRGGGQTSSHEPCKCTHCGRSKHFVDFCWELHGKPFGFANQAFSLEDSPAISGPPASSSFAPDYDLISISKDEYA
jgi:hypothetical protein